MIVIHRKSGKKWFTDGTKDLETHLGVLKKEDLTENNIGKIIKSSRDEEFILIEDNFIDMQKFLKRGPQTTHPKDFGLLVSLTGLSSGWKVVEGGTGSGILTGFLANIVKPNGHVYTYEKRKEFLEIAKRNIKKLKLGEYVTFKLKDISDGIDEKNIDLIILDIKNPWNVLNYAYDSLKLGRYLAVFLPNISSVIELLEKNDNFFLDGIYECFVRKWIYEKPNVLRPKNMQLVHTEFLILMRKL